MNYSDWEIGEAELIQGADCMDLPFKYWRVWARHKSSGAYTCGCEETPEKALTKLKTHLDNQELQKSSDIV